MAGALAGQIAEKALRTGDLVPPERELAGMYKVSRVTIRRALQRLVKEGLLERRPAVGYAVRALNPALPNGAPIGLIYRDLFQFTAGGSQSVPAIEARLAAAGRALLIGASGLQAGRESDCIRRFRAAGAAGLIVAPATGGRRPTELEAWIGQGLPIVLEGHSGSWLLPARLTDRCDQVDIDNAAGMRQAVEHLTALGHRRIGFLLAGAPANSERLASFREMGPAAGITIDPSWIQTDLPAGRPGGGKGFARMMAAGPLPTAVICANDDTALGFIQAARESGLRCPQDISVIGFDNESADGPGALADLTTLDFSREQLASELVRLIEAQATGNTRRPEKVRLPMTLLQRRSCAAPE